jgi:hypothetical protein
MVDEFSEILQTSQKNAKKKQEIFRDFPRKSNRTFRDFQEKHRDFPRKWKMEHRNFETFRQSEK